MKSKVLIFIFGTAIGVAIGAAVFSAKKPQPAAAVAETVPTNAPGPTVAELESELASVKDRHKKAEQQNDLFTARVQSLNQQVAALTPATAPEPAKKPT